VTRLALISDIHGNGVALEAVLSELACRDVEQIVCLGDIAAGGPQPRQVIERLRDLGCPALRGNADRWPLEGLPPGRSAGTARLAEVVDWARSQLSADDLDYLAALPPTLSIALGRRILFCFHGSPRAEAEALLVTTPEAQLDERLAAAPEALVFAGGHTHLQLLRPHRNGLLVNPGSVGLPLGAAASAAQPLPSWAEYALIAVDESELEIAFRRVPIDLAALATATAAMPHSCWAADLTRRIRRSNARAAA